MESRRYIMRGKSTVILIVTVILLATIAALSAGYMRSKSDPYMTKITSAARFRALPTFFSHLRKRLVLSLLTPE